jgi:hypothetical protein
MIHLFDRTYLDLDAYIDQREYRFTISQAHGHPMLELFEKINPGTLLGFAPTLGEIVGEGQEYATIIDLLKQCSAKTIETNSKVVIQCDIDAYMQIASLWFKLIFVNIDVESAYKIIQAEINKNIFYNRNGNNVYYTESMPTLEQFTQAFNSVNIDATTTEASDFLISTRSSRSVEYLLASYYYNGSFSEELRATLYTFMKRKIKNILADCFRIIMQGALSPNTWQIFGLPEYTLDNITTIVEHEQFATLRKLLNDPSCLSSLSAEEIAQLINVIDKVIVIYNTYEDSTFACFPQARDYLGYVPTGLPAEQLESFLQNDVLSRTCFIGRFWESQDHQNINLYLVESFNVLYNRNQINELGPYLLR